MKKILFLFGLLISFFCFSNIFAYSPTNLDTQQLNNLKSQLEQIISGNNQDLRNFYYQSKTLQEQFINDSRLNYMLNELKNHLYTQLNNQKTLAKIQSKQNKQDFVEQLSPQISINQSIPTSCLGRYNTLDDISFAYNFPTALTTATRYRESTCAYYLPHNKNGPFQIITKDYGTGNITENMFIQTVIDFLEFTKSKFRRYDGQLSGFLSYTGFDLTGISNFAALYNGGTRSGDIIMPNKPDYLFDGFGDNFSGARRYGILPKFIKILDREVQNKH